MGTTKGGGDGNSYIGSAVDLSNRLYQHYWGKISNIILQHAIDKYGLSNFSTRVLESCDQSLLLEREQYYFDLFSPEYNINPIAGSRLGAKHSEVFKKKFSEIRSGTNHSEDTKNKISQSLGTTILTYEVSEQLVNSFSSYRAVAKYFSCSCNTIIRYAKAKAVFKKEYILSLEPLSSDTQLPLSTIKLGRKGRIIYLYSSDFQLLSTFNSATEAANYFDCDKKTILKYSQSNQVFNNQYISPPLEVFFLILFNHF